MLCETVHPKAVSCAHGLESSAAPLLEVQILLRYCDWAVPVNCSSFSKFWRNVVTSWQSIAKCHLMFLKNNELLPVAVFHTWLSTLKRWAEDSHWNTWDHSNQNGDGVICWRSALMLHVATISMVWSLLGSPWNGKAVLYLETDGNFGTACAVLPLLPACFFTAVPTASK
jgi:hypothetical protein